MSAPLSHRQKAYLAQLAHRAFNRAAAIARGRGETQADDWRARDDWRHDQVSKACGKAGLRCCSQDDYKLVEAHFLELLGEPGRAFNCFVAAATERRRVAEWKLIHECESAGYPMAYADAICRAQNHGAGLQDVDESTLWRLIYTIRNRDTARRKQAA